MAEELNLRQKLAVIRNYCDVVVKDKQGYGYTYSDITKILAKVKGLMKKHGVSLEPQIVPGSTNVTFQPISKTKTLRRGRMNIWLLPIWFTTGLTIRLARPFQFRGI